MNILILGGTGAMGTDLVNILAKNGEELFVTSRSQRKSELNNVHYIKGNAHDDLFLKNLLTTSYDAIVDFMVYDTYTFSKRKDILLNSTEQYFYLSSARVYANSESPITEKSPRLLDVCKDEIYLKTDEYALAKARQENLIKNYSEKNNWTIVRPYITYNDFRLQLGIYEKEMWLYRLLNDKTIVFPEDVGEKFTTMTYGKDVAYVISKMIGNAKALGQIVHIAQPEPMKWKDVLKLYTDVIEEKTGKRADIIYTKSSEEMAMVSGKWYQFKYDRAFDRKFNSKKADDICGENIKYLSMKNGLKKCLSNFIDNGMNFRLEEIRWAYEGYFDKKVHERTLLKYIPGCKKKTKYFICRYTPYSNLKFLKIKRKV